jgi:hypothetical protein
MFGRISIKHILFFLLLLVLPASAKIIRVTLADGTIRYYTSSQLSGIDIDKYGQTIVTDYLKQHRDTFNIDMGAIEMIDGPVVTDTVMRELTFADENLMTTRKVVSLNMLYPSIDPSGDSITLSGAIHIPEEIWTRDTVSSGLIMFNHATVSNRRECPTNGYLRVESMMLAYYTKPEYIIVESDFYGFGVTERFPQAYLYGLTNAHATIDALGAARKILANDSIETGAHLFNAGYSAGGYDAMATQRLVNEQYADSIKIDHTMAGAGPVDITLMYDIISEADSTDYPVAMPLVLVSYNEAAHLGLKYDEVFQPRIAEKIQDWILSKEYSTAELNDSIGTPHLTEIFLPSFLTNSKGERQMKQLMDRFSMVKGWVPSPDNRIFYFHSTGDEIVPHECAESMVSFLTACGYTSKSLSWLLPSPDLDVNLQYTYIPLLGHISAAASYARQVQSILSAWKKKDEKEKEEKEKEDNQ